MEKLSPKLFSKDQRTVAKELGISCTQVNRIEKRALSKLKRRMNIKVGDLVRISKCTHNDVKSGKFGVVRDILEGQGFGVEVKGKFHTLGDGNTIVAKMQKNVVFVANGDCEVPTTEEILKVLLEL